jgi:glyoxylase-like metal-dependent hydrolase (beta-lactamase superfamily II)
VVSLNFFKSGHCFHPGFISKKGGGFRATQFPAQVAVIKHEKHGVILFDTGYSDHFFKATQMFPEKFYRWITPVHLNESEILKHQLKIEGISLSDVKYIFLSHFHADHIGGVKDFPFAKFVYHHQAYQNLKTLTRWPALKRGFLPALLPTDFLDRSTPILDHNFVASTSLGSEFGGGYDFFGDQSVFMISLPGHEEGHTGLLVNTSDQKSYLLVADACYHRDAFEKENKLPHPLAKLIIHDFPTYKSTISKLSHLSQSKTNIEIIPCHCQDTFLSLNGDNLCQIP